MGNYITLDIELQAIRDFFSKVLENVDIEIGLIYERRKAGEFGDPDDFANALFNPIEREKIAIRAVFHEINALIEWELRSFAMKICRNSAGHTIIPKLSGDVSVNKTSNIKSVYDLPIRKVRRQIERYHKIEFSDLLCFSEVQHIRKAVNAFKHRKGFKDFRRDPGSKLLEKFEPNRENAYQAIDGARAFLRALWKKSKA